MGLDDFASDQWLSEAAADEPEGEDLFDFPRVEMLFQGKQPEEPLPALPSRKPAAAAAPAPAPTPHPAPAVEREAPRAARPARPARKPAPKPKPEPQNAKELDRSVLEPEALAEQAPQLAAELEPEIAPSARWGFQRRLFAGASRTLWIVIALLLGFNATALVVAWSGGRAFHADLEALRNELAVAVHASRVDVAQQQAAASLEVEADGAPADHIQAAPSATLVPARPLAPAEETALAVATREIEARDFASARRRLWRLLAVLDRVDAEHRADVEARASFLLAESWLQQARVARGTTP